VLRNAHLLWLRGEGRRRRREEVAARAWADEPVVELEEEGVVRDLIGSLPPAQARVIQALYFEGLSCEEIARTQNTSASTVRRLKQQALRNLRPAFVKKRQRHMAFVPFVFIHKNVASLWCDLRRWMLGAAKFAALSVVVLGLKAPVHPPQTVQTTAHSLKSGERIGFVTSPRLLDEVASNATHVARGTDDTESTPDFAAAAMRNQEKANAGLPNCQEKTSIQAMLDQAEPGSILRVPACIYREQIVIDKPLHLQAEPGAEIRGSDVWSDFDPFSTEGSQQVHWISRLPVPDINYGPEGPAPCANTLHGSCAHPEQVFMDGRALERTEDLSTLHPGQFFLNDQRHVVLADDPAQRLLEVSVRQGWIVIRANDVSVEGFTMRHASNLAKLGGAIHAERQSRGARIVNNRLFRSSGVALSAEGPGHRIIGNEITEAGWEAIQIAHATLSNPTLVQGNRLYRNGLFRSLARSRWANGGILLVEATATVQDNHIHDNYGLGIMITRSQAPLLRNNVIEDNRGAGIASTGSQGAVIEGNTLRNNGQGASPKEPDIMLIRTSGFQVSGNDFHSDRQSVFVGPNIAPAVSRPGSCAESRHNVLYNNQFRVLPSLNAVEFGGESSSLPCPLNHATGNLIFAITR